MRTLRPGENQGLDLGDWIVLVMSGACLLRNEDICQGGVVAVDEIS